MNQILIGLALAGGLATIVAIYMKFMAGDFKGGAREVAKLKQTILTNDIKTISDNQTIIKKDIDDKNKLTKESQQKIIEIQKQATAEIEEILKENRIQNTSKEIDESWGKI